MSTAIKFGTSGWRAIVADEFTFANVRLAAAATAEYVRSRNIHPVLLVGHDTRFFGEEFARAAAEILRELGVRVLLCAQPTPTPAIAHEILRLKTDGAVLFTASHNSAEYQGLKFSGPDGAPALPEVTRDIEARTLKIGTHAPARPSEEPFESADPQPAYFARIEQLVNFDAIRGAQINFIVDTLHGCGAGYLDALLAKQGVRVKALRTNRDVLFDGSGPDVSEKNLSVSRAAVLANRAAAGLATDGDAGRFGILGSDGAWVQPNLILALVYDYLVETRKWKMPAARSVATSHLLDAVARHHGTTVFQTPVGFKSIGQWIEQDKIAMGGEESAGMSIRGHVPEKDGILACLLVAEMIAVRRKPIAEQLRDLFRRVGREYWPVRIDLALPEEIRSGIMARLQANFTTFLGRKVASLDRTDGLKIELEDGSWVLMRLSGTEPLLRLYAEAGSHEAVAQLADRTRNWVLNAAEGATA